MKPSLFFLLYSTVYTILYRKFVTIFVLVSYAVGLLLPTMIFSASYREMLQIKNEFMQDPAQIVRVEDRNQMLLTKNSNSELNLMEKLKNLRQPVEQIFYKSEFSGVLTDNNVFKYVYIMIVDDTFYENFESFVSKGAWFTPGKTGECILGSGLSRKLWGGEALHKNIRISGTSCVVIGETEVFDNRVIVRGTGEDSFKGMTQFYIKIRNSTSMAQTIDEIRRLGTNLQVDNVERLNQRKMTEAIGVFSVLVILSLIVLLFSLLNIKNIVSFLLDERKKKYGIQLALGLNRKYVYFEFFTELLIITSISVALDFGILYFGEGWINRYLIPIRIDGIVIFTVVGFNLVVCAIIAKLLLHRIMKRNILSLLRSSNE